MGASRLVFGDAEGRGEHGLVREVRCDGVVDMEKEVREARGEVRQEAAGEVAQRPADRLGQVLIVVFLRRPRGQPASSI